MERAAEVQDKLNELSDKYQGMVVWDQVVTAVSGELNSAVQQLKGKQAERFLQDDERELRSALGSVQQQLTQGEYSSMSNNKTWPPSWPRGVSSLATCVLPQWLVLI